MSGGLFWRVITGIVLAVGRALPAVPDRRTGGRQRIALVAAGAFPDTATIATTRR